MITIDKITTAFVIFFIVVAIYGVLDFRHHIKRDVTVENITPITYRQTSGKPRDTYKYRNLFFKEVKEIPNLKDTLYIQVYRDNNPWLDGYYYKVVPKGTTPVPGTEILTYVVRSTYNSNLFDML